MQMSGRQLCQSLYDLAADEERCKGIMADLMRTYPNGGTSGKMHVCHSDDSY